MASGLWVFIEHLRRDPGLFNRTFSHQEIYPPEQGCDADESLAPHTTPLGGAALLRLYDVTPLAWGERFREQDFVSRPAIRLIAERGGQIG